MATDVIKNYPTPRGEFPLTKFGDEPILKPGTVIYRGSVIGRDFEAGHNAVIREECRIGDYVKIQSNSVIDFGCVIEDNVKIHCNCYLAQRTIVGEGTLVSPGVITLSSKTMEVEFDEATRGPKIGKRCRIGPGAIIFPDIKVGDGAWVGAGAVVIHDVKPGSIVVGIPAEPLPGSEEKKTKDWRELHVGTS